MQSMQDLPVCQKSFENLSIKRDRTALGGKAAKSRPNGWGVPFASEDTPDGSLPSVLPFRPDHTRRAWLQPPTILQLWVMVKTSWELASHSAVSPTSSTHSAP